MSERIRLEMTTRERFMQAAKEQMSAFEKREIEFRKKERADRAAELRIPLNTDLQ